MAVEREQGAGGIVRLRARALEFGIEQRGAVVHSVCEPNAVAARAVGQRGQRERGDAGGIEWECDHYQ